MKMARISPRVQHLKERRCPIQSPSSSNSSLNGHARIQAPQGSHFSISGTGKSKPPFFMTILPMDNIKRICRSRCNASRQPFRQHWYILLVLLEASRPVKSKSCSAFCGRQAEKIRYILFAVYSDAMTAQQTDG